VELGGTSVPLESLRLQVFSERYFGVKLLDRSVAAVRPLAPGLVQAVVQDTGGGSITVRWEALRKHGKSDDEMFDLARSQAAVFDQDVVSQVVADCVQLMICNGFYLCAKLLDTFINKELKLGALIAPVSWHHWCLHVVGPMTVAPVASMVHLVAEQTAEMMNVTDAERLGTTVYWVRPGGRVIEPVEVTDDDARLPADLTRALG
jgi:hypothetical protein